MFNEAEDGYINATFPIFIWASGHLDHDVSLINDVVEIGHMRSHPHVFQLYPPLILKRVLKKYNWVISIHTLFRKSILYLVTMELKQICRLRSNFPHMKLSIFWWYQQLHFT